MRIFIFISFVFSLSTFAAEIPALKQLQKTFHGKKGFDVNFEQEVAQSTFKDQRNSAEGRVHFVRPNELKWTYEKPTQRIIQYDGKKLIISEGSDHQEVKDVGPLNLQESFSFLWGETNQNLYQLESLSAEAFRIRPKNPKKGSFRSIEVTLKQGKVSEAKIENNLEGTSRLRFHDWKVF
jgi:outer membrane lipoprotein-sorting protein